MNNVDFNVETVIRVCKEMNNERRRIINILNGMKDLYASVTTSQWAGGTRLNFHKKMFGDGNSTGIIDEMGVTNSNSLCKVMNDLLYHIAEYVCKVYNKDFANVPGYEPKNPSMFVDDSYQVKQANDIISYSELAKVPNTSLNLVILEALETRYKNLCGQLNGSISTFQTKLKELGGAIKDNSVEMLGQYANQLQQKAEDFNNNVSNWLRGNIEIAEDAEAAKKIAQEEISSTTNSFAQESVDVKRVVKTGFHNQAEVKAYNAETEQMKEAARKKYDFEN